MSERRTSPQREIFTNNMFHASVLMQCGASFKEFKRNGRFMNIHLDTTFFNKEALASRLEDTARELREGRPVKDILRSGVLNDIEKNFFRARNRLHSVLNEERAQKRSADYPTDDSIDDLDDSLDDSLDESLS